MILKSDIICTVEILKKIMYLTVVELLTNEAVRIAKDKLLCGQTYLVSVLEWVIPSKPGPGSLILKHALMVFID